MKTARQLVFDLLRRVQANEAYSNLIFDQAVSRGNISREDTAFAAALFYGVLEREITLEAAILPFLKRKLSALDREIRIILQMGLYQLCFMDAVPDRAAVDESVKLAQYAGKKSAKGFVNALLRSFIRAGKPLGILDAPQTPAEISRSYSCPEPLVGLWCEQYGKGRAVQIARASLGRPPIALRVNTCRTTAEELRQRLQNEGIQAEAHPWLNDCLLLSGTGSIEMIPAFREGLFHIQDVSSQICAAALGAKPGERVLDCCAAPGSKSFTIAQHMQNQGEILACDLYEQRCRLIEEGAARLSLSILHTAVRDAASPVSGESYDRILCDVPCSGLGVIRRKPEIKRKPLAQIKELPPIQGKILRAAFSMLRPGGRLVYSTCTLNREENDQVVSAFLKENNSVKPLQLSRIFDKIENVNAVGTTLFPGEFQGDGFYIAVLEKDKG